MKRLAAALAILIAFASPARASDRTTLTLYHLQDVAKVNDAVKDSARLFMQEHEGVSVEVNELVNDVYKRRMAIAAAPTTCPTCSSPGAARRLRNMRGFKRSCR
jgi:ABC-type glycerol-3-phosphate transport system substrate-binding protein